MPVPEDELRGGPGERRRSSPRDTARAQLAFDLNVSLPVTSCVPACKWSTAGKYHLTGIRSVTSVAADDRRDNCSGRLLGRPAAPFAADHFVSRQFGRSMRILRNIVAVLGGILLSGLLMAVAGKVLVHSSDGRALVDAFADPRADSELSEEHFTALWTSLERGGWRIRWIFCPAIAIGVGLFTGYLGESRAPFLGMVAALPFALLMSSPWEARAVQIVTFALYVGLAGTGAWLLARYRHRSRTNDSANESL